MFITTYRLCVALMDQAVFCFLKLKHTYIENIKVKVTHTVSKKVEIRSGHKE